MTETWARGWPVIELSSGGGRVVKAACAVVSQLTLADVKMEREKGNGDWTEREKERKKKKKKIVSPPNWSVQDFIFFIKKNWAWAPLLRCISNKEKYHR